MGYYVVKKAQTHIFLTLCSLKCLVGVFSGGGRGVVWLLDFFSPPQDKKGSYSPGIASVRLWKLHWGELDPNCVRRRLCC